MTDESFPDGAELAEYGEADGADEPDVDELAVAEAGGAVVHLLRRGEAQRLAERRVGEEQPNQELKRDRIALVSFKCNRQEVK